jgi:hypothetical protein
MTAAVEGCVPVRAARRGCTRRAPLRAALESVAPRAARRRRRQAVARATTHAAAGAGNSSSAAYRSSLRKVRRAFRASHAGSERRARRSCRRRRRLVACTLSLTPALAATLCAHFGQYGALSDCFVMVDKSTGRPRGFAFVQFAEADVAARVAAGVCAHFPRLLWARGAPPASSAQLTRRLTSPLRAATHVIDGRQARARAAAARTRAEGAGAARAPFWRVQHGRAPPARRLR